MNTKTLKSQPLAGTRRPDLPHPNPSIALLPGKPKFSWAVHVDENTEAAPVPELTSSPCTSFTSSDSPNLRSQESASTKPSKHSSWGTRSDSTSSTLPDVEYPALLPQPLSLAPPSQAPVASVMDRKRPIGSRNSSFQALRTVSSNVQSRLPQSIDEEILSDEVPTTNHFSFAPLRLPKMRQKRPDEAALRTCSVASISSVNTAKDLPLSPPQIASVDLVTSLEAQLDETRHRRRNLEKMVDNVTALQPQNPLVQDLAARRASKEQVDAFKAELADVKQQEHDVGLRLYRAWKRRDLDEPTAFWVRRITTI